MSQKLLVRAVASVFAAVALLGAGYVIGTHRSATDAPMASAAAATPSAPGSSSPATASRLKLPGATGCGAAP